MDLISLAPLSSPNMGVLVQSLFVFQFLQAVTQERKSLQTIHFKLRSPPSVYGAFLCCFVIWRSILTNVTSTTPFYQPRI